MTFETQLWHQMKRWQFWAQVVVGTAIVIVFVILWLAATMDSVPIAP